MIYKVKWQETKTIWVSASDDKAAEDIAIGLYRDKATLEERKVLAVWSHIDRPEEEEVYGLSD